MSQIALITDSHFGHSNSSELFHNYFLKFYDEIFFPELEKRNIKTIFHLGDVFDKQKELNVNTLHKSRTRIFDKLYEEGYKVYLEVGNHDCFLKHSNSINSVTEAYITRYPQFEIIE